MTSVSIRAVRKAFGATPILHGVSVDLDDGEFTVLVGPSGCGKSTLLRLIAKLRVQTRAELKDLHQRLRTTTIYVTHDQIEAMTMADKIVVMNGGRIEQVGRPVVYGVRPEPGARLAA